MNADFVPVQMEMEKAFLEIRHPAAASVGAGPNLGDM
jgi:hypothetical protein